MAGTTLLGVDDANAAVVGDLFARVDTRAALPGLVDAIGTWRPDVVVRETYEFAGGLAAELHGVPHIRVGLGLASTEAWAVALACPALNEIRAELGLPEDPDGSRVHATPYLTFVPEALAEPALPDPIRTVRCRATDHAAGQAPGPADAPPDLDEWLAGAGRPLVYASLGSVANGLGFFPSLYRTLIDVLATMPVRALVTTGRDADLAALGVLPPNVRVEHWVAPDQVLPHAAAAISHGGFGTTLGALARGVPLVMLPLFASDQWHLARRVADTDAGIVLPRHPEPGRLAHGLPAADVVAALPRAVARVLDDPAHRRAAHDLAEQLAALPSVDEAALDLLAAVTSRSVSPSPSPGSR